MWHISVNTFKRMSLYVCTYFKQLNVCVTAFELNLICLCIKRLFWLEKLQHIYHSARTVYIGSYNEAIKKKSQHFEQLY